MDRLETAINGFCVKYNKLPLDLEVSVGKMHIMAGVKGSRLYCPLALALQEQYPLKHGWEVGNKGCYIYKNDPLHWEDDFQCIKPSPGTKYTISTFLQDFINRFDAGLQVQPIFTVVRRELQ